MRTRQIINITFFAVTTLFAVLPASADLVTFRFRAFISPASVNWGPVGDEIDGIFTWDTSAQNTMPDSGIGWYTFSGPSHAGINLGQPSTGYIMRTDIGNTDVLVTTFAQSGTRYLNIGTYRTDDPTVSSAVIRFAANSNPAFPDTQLPTSWPGGMPGTLTIDGQDPNDPNGPFHLVAIIDPADVQQLQNLIYVGAMPLSVAYNPATKRTYVACQGDGSIYSIDTDHDSPGFLSSRQIPVGTAAVQVVADPQNNRILALTTSAPGGALDFQLGGYGVETLSVIDCATDTVAASIPLDPHGLAIALDVIRHRIIVVGESGISFFNADDLSAAPSVYPLISGGYPAAAVDPTSGTLFFDGVTYFGLQSESGRALPLTGVPWSLEIMGNINFTVNFLAVCDSARRLYGIAGGQLVEWAIPDPPDPSMNGVIPVDLSGLARCLFATSTDTLYVGADPGEVIKLVGDPKAVAETYVTGLFPRSIVETDLGLFVANWGDNTVSFIGSIPPKGLLHAGDDSKVTAENTPVTIPVLANDSDSDGDSLSITSVTQPSNGTATITTDGTVTYSPAQYYNGPDSFTYTIGDGHGNTATANVTITVTEVNQAPTAVDQSTTTQENSPITISQAALLKGDSPGSTNESGQTLTVVGVGKPAHGTAMLNADGSVTYTPPLHYSGPDSFSFTIQDNGTTNGIADPRTATANVNLTVTHVNQAPAAVNDLATTPGNTPVTIDVLANDTDVDGDTLIIKSVTQGGSGSVAIAGGKVVYTPNPFSGGTDTFSYTITDNGTTNGAPDPKSATASVSVTVYAVNVTSMVTVSQSAFKLNKKTGHYEQNVSVLNNSNVSIPNISYVLDNMTGGTVYVNNGYTQYLAPIGSPYLGQYATGTTVLLAPGKTQKFMVEVSSTTGKIAYTPRVLAGYGAR